MVHEAYVSFETAKLLKEKGFDVPVPKCYSETFDNKEYEKHSFELADWNHRKSSVYNGYPFVSRPTHQMACAWLREVHNIFIEIGTSIDLNGKYHFSYTILDKECKYIRRGYTDFDWNYEDAVEEALKYVLENLI